MATGNPEERSRKSNSDHDEGPLSASECLPESPTCLSTHTGLFPLNKHFTYLTAFRLCGNSFLKS